MQRLSSLALLLACASLGGCRNSCQQLCGEMADYAVETCNLEFESDELKTTAARRTAPTWMPVMWPATR